MSIFKKKEKSEDSEDTLITKRMRAVVDKIIEDTKADRDEMTRFLDRFKGKWWDLDKLKDTDSTIVANLFFSTVMTIAPLITDNRPIWGVRARKPYLQNYIDGLSVALEYLWDKLDLDMTSFKYILDALIMKIGIIKCWFDPDDGFGGEHKVEVVDPRLYFCAPGYDDNWDAPLQGTRIRKPLSWIHTHYPDKASLVKPDTDNEKFPENAEKWELENKYATVYEVWVKDDTIIKYFTKKEGDKEIEVDKKDEGTEEKERPKYPFGRLIVFTKDCILEDKASIYRHSKPPYVLLYDYILPHSLIGMGEGNQIEEIGKSYNRSLQLFDNYVKHRCDPPVFIDSNINVDIEDLKKSIPAGGGVFAADFSRVSGGKPMLMGEIGQLDPAVPQFISGLSKLNEEISGVTDITKGMTSKSQRQSATEISTLIESSYTRTRQRVRNYEWSIKRLLYLILCNTQQFYTEPRDFSLSQDNNINYYTIGSSRDQVAETIKPQGQQEQPEGEMSDEDIQAEKDYEQFIKDWGEEDIIFADFDLEIQTNSTLPMDKQSLANLFLRLLEMAGGNPVTGMPMWEAALSSLRIPKYKQIIAKMQELFDKQNQPPQGEAPQGAETGGPPDLMGMIQRAGA